MCCSSQRHLLFLFLGLQYRREGDLKGCPARREKRNISGLGALRSPCPLSTCEDTHSHVVQMGLKLQKTVKNAKEQRNKDLKTRSLSVLPPPPIQTVRKSTHQLTGQTHGADIANLNETSMTEAGSPVVHMDRRRED